MDNPSHLVVPIIIIIFIVILILVLFCYFCVDATYCHHENEAFLDGTFWKYISMDGA